MLAIDGVSVQGLPLPSIEALLVGEHGADVELKLVRVGPGQRQDTYSVVLKRDVEGVGQAAEESEHDRGNPTAEARLIVF